MFIVRGLGDSILRNKSISLSHDLLQSQEPDVLHHIQLLYDGLYYFPLLVKWNSKKRVRGKWGIDKVSILYFRHLGRGGWKTNKKKNRAECAVISQLFDREQSLVGKGKEGRQDNAKFLPAD